MNEQFVDVFIGILIFLLHFFGGLDMLLTAATGDGVKEATGIIPCSFTCFSLLLVLL